jgi:cytochrome oxidase assembly protein ShyY1
VVPVVRGWVATPDEAPAAPSGRVRVDGYLQASEATDGTGHTLPAGQVDSVSSAQLANRWGGPIYSGYVVLRDSDPAADPAVSVLPRPKIEGSGDLNFQSLSYAFQWWLFAVFAVFVWWRIVRDQRDHENAALAAADDGALPEDPGRRPHVRRGEDGIAGLPARH